MESLLVGLMVLRKVCCCENSFAGRKAEAWDDLLVLWLAKERVHLGKEMMWIFSSKVKNCKMKNQLVY